MSVIKQRCCLLLFIIVWSCAGILFTHAQLHDDEKLHPDEVEALKEIAKQVGKKDWNFSIDPCRNHTVWKTPKSIAMPWYNNTVNCTCHEGICHVIHIFLKGQDLDGVLPPSIAKLPYLKFIDFTKNYLRGNIPREWATMKNLEYLSITVNNLTGPIPTYFGNITSLVFVCLESNMSSGAIPPELGKLVNLVNLILWLSLT